MNMEENVYFAYGSNMSEEQMAFRCPDAYTIGKANVSGWEFKIMERGYATITPSEDSVVWGVLWALSANDERRLDRYEGVSAGLYTRDRIVVDMNGQQVEALVYVAPLEADGVASDAYMESVINGAKAFGFPTAYINEIREAA